MRPIAATERARRARWRLRLLQHKAYRDHDGLGAGTRTHEQRIYVTSLAGHHASAASAVRQRIARPYVDGGGPEP
jgi:hypothetical protein